MNHSEIKTLQELHEYLDKFFEQDDLFYVPSIITMSLVEEELQEETDNKDDVISQEDFATFINHYESNEANWSSMYQARLEAIESIREKWEESNN